jgi:hypothetical protein
MEHFAEENWADFVRGTSSSEINSRIAAHLGSACISCKTAFDMWTRVRTFSANEVTFIAPEDIVRMVKMEFAIRRQTEPQDFADGTLVFDSLTQPVLAGVRSGPMTARQVVYEVDGLTLDLRLDAQARSNKVCVIGQVLDKRVPRASLGEAMVILWNERGLPIQTTKTSEFGEFHLEFEPQETLRLSIHLAGLHPVRIPLGKLAIERVTKGTSSSY